MSEIRMITLHYALTEQDQDIRFPMDICKGCESNDGAPCEALPFCAAARARILAMVLEDIKMQSGLPRGKCADYLSGYQYGNTMAQNALYDRISGKLEEVLNRAAGE